MTVKKMMMIALSVAIVFVQEQVLVFLPNIQFTVLLLFVFASVYTLKENTILILSYVLLDNMYMGGFNLFYMVPMFLAWMFIPIVYKSVLRRTNNELTIAVFAFLFGFFYGWMFMPFTMLQTGVYDIRAYLVMDIPYELIMAIAGFVSVYWLYTPLVNIMRNITEPLYLEPAYHKG